jgi:hypothetical protein
MTLRSAFPKKASSRAAILTERFIVHGLIPRVEHVREGSRKVKTTLILSDSTNGEEKHRITAHFNMGEIRSTDWIGHLLHKAYKEFLDGEGNTR